MRSFNLFIFILVLVLIQLSVLGSFVSPARIPNLVLALIVCFVVYRGFEKYLGWIIFSGFLLDIGASRPLGSTSLLLVLVALGIDRLNAVSNIKSRHLLFYLSLAVIFALSLFIFDWASVGLLNIEKYFLKNNQLISSPVEINFDYFLKSAYTILGGFVIYLIIRKLEANDFPKIFQQKTSG